MINKIINDIIESKGVTNSFLSRETGISADAISRIRLSKRKVQADELIKLCIALNIDVGVIADRLAVQQKNNPPA